MSNILDDLLAYSRVRRLDHETVYIKVNELAQSILDLVGTTHRFELAVTDMRICVPVVPF